MDFDVLVLRAVSFASHAAGQQKPLLRHQLHTIALLNIEPFGSEFGGRNP
jgi:hypothetical protein